MAGTHPVPHGLQGRTRMALKSTLGSSEGHLRPTSTGTHPRMRTRNPGAVSVTEQWTEITTGSALPRRCSERGESLETGSKLSTTGEAETGRLPLNVTKQHQSKGENQGARKCSWQSENSSTLKQSTHDQAGFPPDVQSSAPNLLL